MISLVLFSLIILIGLLTLGVPLPFCFGGSLFVMAVFGGVTMKGMLMWGFNQLINPVLLCMPLFVLAGNLMANGGIARSLLDFVNVFVGRIKGGLGIVSVITCAVIGAVTGSGFTGVAATGPILIPRMEEEGYPRGYATALCTCSSTLGLLIPPSTLMIIYGWITGTSILACFLATIGPGLLLMLLFIIINFFYVRKNPNIKLDEELQKRSTPKIFVSRFWKAIPALMMPVIILGGIYGGVFTPTEAAAVGVVYSIPIGFWVYKGLTFKDWVDVTVESTTAVGSIMFMIIFCLMLSQTFVFLQIPQAIVKLMFSITDNTHMILIMINVLLFVLGMLVNDVTGVVLAAPMLLPLVIKIGVSPIHFAAIMAVNLGLGGLTPPYASLLYLGMRIGNVEFMEIIKPTLILLLFGFIPVVLITSFFPSVVMFIPSMFGFVH